MDDIAEAIRAKYPTLTPRQQRAAGFLLDHLSDVAVYDSAELAAMSGVSKATMSRLSRALGFPDWRGFREAVREARHAGGPRTLSIGTDVITRHAASEIANLRAFFSDAQVERINRAAHLLVRADKVMVLGFRNSYPLALHLREQLSQLRTDVWIAPQPGQSLGEDVTQLGADDVALVVGLRRRPESFPRLIDQLERQQVPTILIGDPTARRFDRQVPLFLGVELESVGAMSSYTTAMSVACALENAVAALDTPRSSVRTGLINEAFDRLAEIEDPW